MRTVAVYAGPYFRNWSPADVSNGIGGSETWAFEVSKRLSQSGFYVVLYAQPEVELIISNSFRIKPYWEFKKDTSNFRYDFILISRYLDVINPWMKCDNVYAMVHDVCFMSNTPTLGLDRIKKYGYLSDWHKWNLLELYGSVGLTEDRLLKVTNGFSNELYQESSEKTRSMIWSSSLVRGFFDTYRLVLLPLIKEFPDFKIRVCCGTVGELDQRLLAKASLLPNVEVLTKIPKSELAKYQREALLWVYPGTFAETFCITAVENCAAKNVVICPPTYGLATTLEGYTLWNEPEFDRMPLHDGNAWWFLNHAREVLRNGQMEELVQSSYAISTKYTWDQATLDWINEFNSQM